MSAPSLVPVTLGLIALLLLMLAGPATSFREGTDSGGGSTLRQVAYLSTFLLAVGGSWRFRNGRFPLPLSVAAIFVGCAITLAWSSAPDIAGRRLVLTVMIAWTIFATVRVLGYRTALDIFRTVAIAALIGNFLCVLLIPSFGIHQYTVDGAASVVGTWRGFMMQKNIAGLLCAVTVIVFAFDASRWPLAGGPGRPCVASLVVKTLLV